MESRSKQTCNKTGHELKIDDGYIELIVLFSVLLHCVFLKFSTIKKC